MKSEESCCCQRFWMVATSVSISPNMAGLRIRVWGRSISWRFGEICILLDSILLRHWVSQSSELGTSSGGLNTGGNHSESFLEALCGLGLRSRRWRRFLLYFFMSHRLHGFTQILSYSGLRAPGISEPRCKDTKMVRGQFTVAHTCSYFLIDFLCSGICKPVDYAA